MRLFEFQLSSPLKPTNFRPTGQPAKIDGGVIEIGRVYQSRKSRIGVLRCHHTEVDAWLQQSLRRRSSRSAFITSRPGVAQVAPDGEQDQQEHRPCVSVDDILSTFGPEEGSRVLDHLLRFEPMTVEGLPVYLAYRNEKRRSEPTPWRAGPWEYDDDTVVPRRKPIPDCITLDAPKFDYTWSDEYRSVFLVAPPCLPWSSVPLLKMFLGSLSSMMRYQRWWSRRLPVIVSRAVYKPPKTLEALANWYPKPPDPPPAGDRTEWTSRRLLDGFALLPLYADGDGHIFMDVNWDHHKLDGPYKLPNVRVWWHEGSEELFRIDIDARKPRSRNKRLTKPKYTPSEHLVRRRVERDSASDLHWQQALYIARSVVLLAGEIDTHVARAHLLAEEVALMLNVHCKNKTIKKLLGPFVRGASGVNQIGEPLIIGKYGVLTRTSALKKGEVALRAARELATWDWRQFDPTHAPPLMKDRHAYTKAATAFWKGIRATVTTQIDQKDLVAPVQEMLRSHATCPGVPSHRARVLPKGATAQVWPSPTETANPAGHMSVPQNKEEVVDFFSTLIFHFTCLHSWTNDQQWVDGGELSRAVFGLRTIAPTTTEAFWREAAPKLKHGAMQLAVGYALDQIQWGLFGNIGEDSMESRDKTVHKEKELFETLEGAFECTHANRDLADLGTPLSQWRCRVNS